MSVDELLAPCQFLFELKDGTALRLNDGPSGTTALNSAMGQRQHAQGERR